MPEPSEIKTTPTANAPLEIKAIAESPLILEFDLTLNRRIDVIVTTGTDTKSGEKFKTDAKARAPNPTCERPSPIIEYLFRTKGMPKSAAQSDTIIPTTKALKNKLYDSNSKI